MSPWLAFFLGVAVGVALTFLFAALSMVKDHTEEA